jgi:hypothetical protein
MSLVTALGAGEALSQEAAPSVSERKEAAYLKIFQDRIAHGELVITGDAAPLSGVGMTGEVSETEVDSSPCFTEDEDPLMSGGQIRGATLMLMAVYQNDTNHEPFSFFGTGTVIRAETGINRVLTAAHVANPEITTSSGEGASLVSVHAFDGDGRLVANLEPALYNGDRILSGEITQDFLHEDVMVLSPSAFPSTEMADSWQGRGVEVSPVQSRTVIFFHGDAGASFIAPGHSGAALLDPEGRAVGLVTEIVPIPNSYRPAADTIMPEATLDRDLPPPSVLPRVSLDLLEEVASGPSAGVTVDAVAGGPPLSSPRVLNALGVDPERVEVVQTLGADELFSAGFPGRECRTSRLTYTPRAEVPFLDRTEGHVSTPLSDPVVYTQTPGDLLIMDQGGRVVPPQPGTGFGLVDFLASIDAMVDAAQLETPVTDPFLTVDPEQSPGEPQ